VNSPNVVRSRCHDEYLWHDPDVTVRRSGNTLLWHDVEGRRKTTSWATSEERILDAQTRTHACIRGDSQPRDTWQERRRKMPGVWGKRGGWGQTWATFPKQIRTFTLQPSHARHTHTNTHGGAQRNACTHAPIEEYRRQQQSHTWRAKMMRSRREGVTQGWEKRIDGNLRTIGANDRERYS